MLLKAELFFHVLLCVALLFAGTSRLRSDSEMRKRFFGAYLFYQALIVALLMGKYVWWPFLSLLAAISSYEILSAMQKGTVRQILGGILFWGLTLLSYYALFQIPLQKQQAGVVLWICIVVQFSDVAAYMIGKKYGKRKIFPRLSPGKTYEGTFGALFSSLPLSAFLLFYFDLPHKSFCLFMTVPLVLLGQLGDAVESLFKRILGKKDLGTIVYGHGGVCDRMDSFLFVMPAWLLLSKI